MARRNFNQSHNPFLKEEALRQAPAGGLDQAGAAGQTMTVQGAINKTLLLASLLVLAGMIGFAMPNPLFMWGGAIGGLIVVVISAMKPHLSPTLAPIYALLEGLFVGSITAFFASAYSGIVFNAITLTIAMLFLMLFIYKSGLIQVTDKFRTGVFMATGGVFVLYLINMVLSFFGMSVPFLHEGGLMGIGISLVIIGIAALNLLLDFDNFEKGAQYGAPKYMEWFCGMGLLITLVWLYIEILRLLAIISSND